MKQFTKYTEFIRHITYKKLINLLKITSSFILSNLIKKPIRWGMPLSLSIEPTNYCNLKCPQCLTGLNILSRPKGFIDFSLYKKIVDQASPYLLNLFLYFQGQPFLHKEITQMIKYAKQKNLFTGLSTNAQYINPKIAKQLVQTKLSYIIISLDGMHDNVYKLYRQGGSIDKVFDAINNLLEAKKKLMSSLPIIEIQFLILKTNQHQINDFLNFCKNKKVICKLKTAQIEDFNTAKIFLPSIEKFSRYKLVQGKWQIKKKIKNHCWRLWNSIVITWDGKVVPCCYDKDAKYMFERIQNSTLNNIIKNKKFYQFAKTVLTNRQNIDICRNCNE